MVLSQRAILRQESGGRRALVYLGDIARCLEHESPSAIKSKQELGECGSDRRGKSQGAGHRNEASWAGKRCKVVVETRGRARRRTNVLPVFALARVGGSSNDLVGRAAQRHPHTEGVRAYRGCARGTRQPSITPDADGGLGLGVK